MRRSKSGNLSCVFNYLMTDKSNPPFPEISWGLEDIFADPSLKLARVSPSRYDIYDV